MLCPAGSGRALALLCQPDGRIHQPQGLAIQPDMIPGVPLAVDAHQRIGTIQGGPVLLPVYASGPHRLALLHVIALAAGIAQDPVALKDRQAVSLLFFQRERLDSPQAEDKKQHQGAQGSPLSSPFFHWSPSVLFRSLLFSLRGIAAGTALCCGAKTYYTFYYNWDPLPLPWAELPEIAPLFWRCLTISPSLPPGPGGGFVKGIPLEIEEAALIDGCNPLQVFFKILIPILKPTIISTAILQLMWVWNDYLLPTLVLDIKKYRTIPMAVQYFRGSFGHVQMGPMMASIMIDIIPIVIVYLVCQKYIIEGVVAGAVKG